MKFSKAITNFFIALLAHRRSIAYRNLRLHDRYVDYEHCRPLYISVRFCILYQRALTVVYTAAFSWPNPTLGIFVPWLGRAGQYPGHHRSAPLP